MHITVTAGDCEDEERGSYRLCEPLYFHTHKLSALFWLEAFFFFPPSKWHFGQTWLGHPAWYPRIFGRDPSLHVKTRGICITLPFDSYTFSSMISKTSLLSAGTMHTLNSSLYSRETSGLPLARSGRGEECPKGRISEVRWVSTTVPFLSQPVGC